MKDSIIKKVISIITVLLFTYALYYFRNLLGFLLISVGLSFAGRPIVSIISKIKFKGKSVPKSFGAIVALLTFIIAGGGVIALFGPLIVAQAKALSSIDTQQLAGDLKNWAGVIDQITRQFDLGHDGISSLLLDSDIVDIGSVSSLFKSIIHLLGTAFIAVFSILFMTFFFLKDSKLFYKMIIALTPDSQVDKIKNIMESSSKLLTSYFSGLVVQVSIVTVMVTTGLLIIGADYALLLGFMAGLLNLIPFIGPLIGTLIGLIIIATTHSTEATVIIEKLGSGSLNAGATSGATAALFGEATGVLSKLGSALIVYIITQLVDNLITQPFLFSKRVKAHPLEIFIVISMAGMLAGVLGMILAVPAYTLLRIIANEFLSGHKIVDALTESIEE